MTLKRDPLKPNAPLLPFVDNNLKDATEYDKAVLRRLRKKANKRFVARQMELYKRNELKPWKPKGGAKGGNT